MPAAWICAAAANTMMKTTDMQGSIESWNPAAQTGIIVAPGGERLMLHAADWQHPAGHAPQENTPVIFDAHADRARNVRPLLAAVPVQTPLPQHALACSLDKTGFYCTFVFGFFFFFWCCINISRHLVFFEVFSQESTGFWFLRVFYAGWVISIHLKLISAIAALAASGGSAGRGSLKVCAALFAFIVGASLFLDSLSEYFHVARWFGWNLIWIFWFCFCLYIGKRVKRHAKITSNLPVRVPGV